MSIVAELLCSRRVPPAAVLALVSFAIAGCSADTSSRFSQTVTNPFNYQPESTGSVPAAAPAPQVERRDLSQSAHPQPYASSASGAPPVVAAPQSYPSTGSGVSGGGRGMASYAPPPVNSYAPPPQPRLETTGSVPPRSVAVAAPPRPAHVKIIVGTSDTLEVLAHRYHVTPAAILAANGYKGPRTLSPGQSLVIPQPAAPAVATEAPSAAAPVAAVPPAPVAPAVKPVAVAAAPTAAATVHVVNKGDTLHSIARRYHVSVAELTRSNKLDAGAKLKLGMRLNVPAKVAAAAPVALVAAPQPVAAPPAAAPKLASAAPPQSARLAQASPAAEDDAPPAATKASETTGALPTFRWPVRGKVIAGYGAKTNGKANDGINLAVPEGTPVKAAEDGVVAYAGNELKGYGNLVLVRHANGYVTAYAHASELLVKRGDPIKRGQVIAKSGQSGEVASPQLHFEIRKGSNPVDPLQFLNGA
jgi:murein DD-endopeptidase MepM/ murein hydrolase activator NlpD